MHTTPQTLKISYRFFDELTGLKECKSVNAPRRKKSLPHADEPVDPFKDDGGFRFREGSYDRGISSRTRIPGYRYACHEARYRRGRRISGNKSKSNTLPLACAAWSVLGSAEKITPYGNLPT